jgi:hypothetical protein
MPHGAKNSKGKVEKVNALMYTKSRPSPSNSSGISVPSLRIDLWNQNCDHEDGFKQVLLSK